MILSSRRTNVLMLVCAVSLSVNLFIGGQWVGTRFSSGDESRAVARPVESFTLSLPPDAQRVMRKAFMGRRDDMTRKFRGLQQAQRAVGAAIAQDPYDPNAVHEKLQQLRQAGNEMQTMLDDAFSSAVGNLPLDIRGQVAADWRVRASETMPAFINGSGGK